MLNKPFFKQVCTNRKHFIAGTPLFLYLTFKCSDLVVKTKKVDILLLTKMVYVNSQNIYNTMNNKVEGELTYVSLSNDNK